MRKIIFVLIILFSSLAYAANVISYPDRPEKLRISGEVNVLYDITNRGRVENIRLVSAEPEYVFNRSVKKQLSFWKYQEGKPQTDVPLRVIFKAN
ncbi:TonB family protein [Pantoea sp. PNT02]|uniref:TonB family protein n=1 Tax=Pantoea sp. PNT02 TaxID=2769261 RepID=UPI0017809491|nr:TonB family protein [Pantoea sp. PNT02]MBD9642935.1 TonB family protein [Pantoea sp. PNT02]